MFHYEGVLRIGGYQRVAGVDEAGVGPLAGPVVAAAVILPTEGIPTGIDDSKRLTASTRERLAKEISHAAVAFGIGVVDVREIDALNIYQASLLAMRRAIEVLTPEPDHLLIDARRLADLSVPQTSLVKGDQRSVSIAAASILAKTERDRIMVNLDRLHPGYGFADHMGYPTRFHREALGRLGPCPVHRLSFPSVREFCHETSEPYRRLFDRLEEASDSAQLEAARESLRRHRGELSKAEYRRLYTLLRKRQLTDTQPLLPGFEKDV
jgi:ribonuclease HII